MAEEVQTEAIAELLNTLKNVVADHMKLIKDAPEQLNQLENNLRLMKAFLKDESKRKNKSEQFKEYERQIREVVYLMEDTIESCNARAGLEKPKSTSSFLRFLSAESFKKAKQVGDVNEIKVKQLFTNVHDQLQKIAPAAAAAASNTNAKGSRDQSEQVRRHENVVGFEDEMEKLIRYLSEEPNKVEVEVIAITGMPGIGKTTLARKIYNDPKIQSTFPIRIWVNVSQEFNEKNVLLSILKKFTTEDMSSKDVDHLANSVIDYLKDKQFLIYFDDVWTVQAWEKIQEILPTSNKMGKVLITTRSDYVAMHANNKRQFHKLQLLDKNKSWELLKLEVFGELCDCPSELQEVGKLIAEHCEGHPLAIKVMGKVLAEKNLMTRLGSREKKWEMVLESIKNSLYHEDKEKRMKDVISLSYTCLDYDLRDCFLYLGIFPQKTEIPAWKLTQLWIAEGFIKENSSGKSLEKIAQDNLNELIKWNLVNVDKRNPDDSVKSCSVHITVSEFCRNEASYEQNNIFQEIRKSNDGTFVPSVQQVYKYRRLCINSCVKEFLLKNPNVKRTRSFFGFSEHEPINLEGKDIPSITDSFELLRVLDSKSIRFTKFPTKLTKLIHLRYVILSGDEFKVIPEAISNLCNVRTFIVYTSSPTIQMKADIWKMMQLKHFKTKASIILKKNGKGKGGENLQILSRLSPKSCTDDVFNKAKNLKTLGIRGQLDRLSGSTCLVKLELLEKLKMMKVPDEKPLQGLPQFPPYLKILTLSGTSIEWSHLFNKLGKLDKLEVLKLKDNAFVGNSWEAVGGGFPHLELLHVEATNLKIWTAAGKNDPFPRLTSIVLKNCKELEQLPVLYKLGKHIEMLSMEGVSQSAIDSAEKIKTEAAGKFKIITVPPPGTITN